MDIWKIIYTTESGYEDEIGCNECKRIFMEDMEKDIRKAVRRL